MNAQPPPPPPPPPPATPPPPAVPPLRRVDPSELSPGRFWYGIAAAIAVAGVVVAVLLFTGIVSDIGALTGNLTRLETPGAKTLQLEAGDERTIYQQTRGASGPIRTPGNADVKCVVGGPSGKIDVNDTLFGFTLSRDDDHYTSIQKFTADEAGSYNVGCEDKRDSTRRIPLAIGESFGIFHLVGGLLGGVLAFFGGFLIAGAIVIVVAIMRSNRKSKLARQPPA